ncbi:hypothetical protein CTA2_852 [Colletotrichum tanaceti]|uniref:Uncharacterized protein n=1 Tax=Colletotrichum tanaceti TaxID=1306861 RepID=A0A4U6XJT1_9PEZI|nr:hypothetical protein CTA2_852 [Colletotrichum tanaceti]TKW56121.1 hypothetical protein CTA1_8265 [Colletotrichum tanaceti]
MNSYNFYADAEWAFLSHCLFGAQDEPDTNTPPDMTFSQSSPTSTLINTPEMRAMPMSCSSTPLGQCRVQGLAFCLQAMDDKTFPWDLKSLSATALDKALMQGPHFVSMSHSCCGNTLLSLVAAHGCSVDTMGFLLSRTRFREEHGYRISDFVEELGRAMVTLVTNSRARCVGNCLPGDGKKCLYLLLRAATLSSYAKANWYHTGEIRSWVLKTFKAACTWKSPSAANADPELDDTKTRYPAPIPALLDFAECIIESSDYHNGPDGLFDATLWTGILKCLWTHERITKGTMTRVTNVTLRLLSLGASKEIELPSSVKGSNFLAYVKSGLSPDEGADPNLDDIDVIIEEELVRPTSVTDSFLSSESGLLLRKRQENIAILQMTVLGAANTSSASPAAMVMAATGSADLGGTEAQSNNST